MNQTRTRRALLALGASAVALTGFDMAWAADAPAAEPSNTIEAIVVTAQRREESANTVGMAIQAFRGDQLTDVAADGAPCQTRPCHELRP